MSDNVNHPSHYTQGGIEAIDAMIAAFGTEAVRAYCRINAFKYVWRSEHKNGAEDIQKAVWYLNKYLELDKEKPTEEVHDTISLASAFEHPAWIMSWAAEPDRKVDVTMTYEDLKIIYDLVKKARVERESKRSD